MSQKKSWPKIKRTTSIPYIYLGNDEGEQNPPSYIYLGGKECQKIKEILKVEQFDKNHLKKLRSVSQIYLIEISLHPFNPRNSETRFALLEIMKQSDNLLHCMDHFDNPTRSWFCHLIGILDEEYEQLHEGLENFRDSVKIPLEDLPPDRGGPNPTNTSLEGFIIRLAGLFEKITGRDAGYTYDSFDNNKPYKGLFFDFVKFCLSHLNSPPKSNQSLGSAIKRALAKRCPSTPS